MLSNDAKSSEIARENGEGTSISVRDRLIEDLPKNEELRYDYDEEFLNTYISAQIRALREDRELTQAGLAKLAKTGQSQISEMEGDYNSWSLRTLRKLARAFGVRLFVSFESWGELLPRVEGFSRESLVRPIIEKDAAFKPATEVTSTVPQSIRGFSIATDDNVLPFYTFDIPLEPRKPPKKAAPRRFKLTNDWMKVSADA